MNVRTAVVAGVIGAVLVGAAGFAASRGSHPPASTATAPGPVVTLSPPATTTPTPTSTPTHAPTGAAPAPTATGGGPDDQPFPGARATLTPDGEAVVDTLVTQAATALTTQTPGEQRYARLLGFFAPGSAGPRQAGPAPDQPGAVVVPRVVNWTRAFDPGNATQLGVYISVHYDIAKPAPGGTSTFGHGDVQWQLWLDHSGSGWAVTAVQMVGSSDY